MSSITRHVRVASTSTKKLVDLFKIIFSAIWVVNHASKYSAYYTAMDETSLLPCKDKGARSQKKQKSLISMRATKSKILTRLC